MTLSTIRACCDYYAETTPDAPFLLYGDTSYSYAEAQKHIQNIARTIAAQGIKTGATVAYACSNSPEAALCILGIMYGGYIATAVNLVSGDTTIGYVLEHSEVELIFVDPVSETLVRPLAAHTTTILRLDQVSESSDATAEYAMPNEDDYALLMYTSGTTGRPKGVLHSHKSMLAGGKNVVIGHELTAQDRALCVLPLYHINGLCVTLMGPLSSGSSVALPEKFSTSKFWPDIQKHHCSWFSVVPTQISYLLHQDTPFDKSQYPALRFGRSASAPLSPDVHTAFEARFSIPMIETMGLNRRTNSQQSDAARKA